MAKLNGVVAVVSSITVGGVSYVESTEKAVAGDIVRCEDSGYLGVEKGDYFDVIDEEDKDGDSPSIKDNAGDVNSPFERFPQDWTVFKRQVAEVVPLYRTVKRRANVGERIKIVNAYDNEPYNNGDIAITTESTDSDGDGNFDFNGGTYYVAKREYVVLEPLKMAEPKEPRLKVGEYAVVNEGATGNIKAHIGRVTLITDDDGGSGTDAPFAVSTLDGGYIGWAYESEVRRATEAEVSAALAEQKWSAIGRKVDEFRKGDIVRSKTAVGSVEDVGVAVLGIRTFTGSYEVFDKSATTLIATAESRLDGKAV